MRLKVMENLALCERYQSTNFLLMSLTTEEFNTLWAKAQETVRNRRKVIPPSNHDDLANKVLFLNETELNLLLEYWSSYTCY